VFKPWAVRHIDLAAPLEAFGAAPELGGAVLVFWYGDIPLGRYDVEAAQLPLSTVQLLETAIAAVAPAVGDQLLDRGFRAPLPEKEPARDPPPDFAALRSLARPLERVAARIERASDEAPDEPVSVIVCTRERPDALRNCLARLQQLDPAPDEIVVVDNAPRSGATRTVVEGFPGVGYVLEPTPGLSAARNAGLRHSSSALVAFTDDDVLVHPTWVGRIRAAFADPGVMAVTGLILPAVLETPAQLLFEQDHAGFGRGFRALDFDRGFFERMRRYAVPVWQLGAGANMAFRRRVFDDLGGFDERLGAGASGCSEDSEMWYRILAHGYRCRYDPTAVVHHVHRREMEGLGDQMFQYMRGHIAALLAQFEKHGHAGNLRRAFLTLPNYYGRWVLRRLRGVSGGPSQLGAQIRGCAAGFAYYLRHRTAAPAAPPVDPVYAPTSA
jgi:GT2 family glycosyltransferase